MSSRAQPVGGSLLTPFTGVLGLLVGLAGVLIVWRFAVGLGPATNLSDAYPWGLWIAFDVVTGTALACGGYGVALMVYIANKGKFHPLVRPALLTSALGYSVAGLSIVVDVGRPWNFWRVPLSPNLWNLDSVLLEVALCIMLYTAVVWVELVPVLLEPVAGRPDHPLHRLARTVTPLIERAMIPLVALGLLLPTMHQSSLGTLILASGDKLHPLWSTGWIPLLFLVSCLTMGYAMVVLESSLAMAFFGRKPETAMLRTLAVPVAGLLLFFVAWRLADIVVAGKIGLAFTGDLQGVAFLAEILLFSVPAFVLLATRRTARIGLLFPTAMVVVAAGALYRFDTYTVAFNPGEQFAYFPSLPELFITFGFVAGEVLLYILLVQRFPILGGLRPAPTPSRSPS